jgi:hypothetical protein
MKILALFAFAAVAFAQSPVYQVDSPTPMRVLGFPTDGTSLRYLCYTPQRNDLTTSVKRAATATLTNIAVSSNTATVTTVAAHGLYVGARVTVSGATVDSDLNGSYTVLTIPTSTTYTFTTAAVSDATYVEATLIISTSETLTTAESWKIQVITYVGTVWAGTHWANGGTSFTLRCSDQATY